MKTSTFDNRLPAPNCQLNEIGTPSSNGILKNAVTRLPNSELKALEEELRFYDSTGLVGVRMSRVLAMFGRGIESQAA